MKHKLFLLFLLAILILPTAYSQVDVSSLGFNFSSLVRDTAGRVQPSKGVNLRFTLLLGQNGTTANSPYIETQNTTTDAYGFVNVTIGSGTKVKGSSFSKVDFSLANYWILIEVFNTFTKAFDPLAKQALQAVPYAKVAGSLKGASVIPSGTIVAFGGDTNHIPSGWLLCNGRELDNTILVYKPLFDAIKYNWGTTNNTNLFNVPNTGGLFLRGAQNGNGYDPDVASRTPSVQGANGGDNVGSYQPDIFASHQHIAPIATDVSPWGIGGDFNNLIWGVSNNYYHAGNTSRTGGSETRPRNVYVNYIIKL